MEALFSVLSLMKNVAVMSVLSMKKLYRASDEGKAYAMRKWALNIFEFFDDDILLFFLRRRWRSFAVFRVQLGGLPNFFFCNPCESNAHCRIISSRGLIWESPSLDLGILGPRVFCLASTRLKMATSTDSLSKEKDLFLCCALESVFGEKMLRIIFPWLLFCLVRDFFMSLDSGNFCPACRVWRLSMRQK